MYIYLWYTAPPPPNPPLPPKPIVHTCLYSRIQGTLKHHMNFIFILCSAGWHHKRLAMITNRLHPSSGFEFTVMSFTRISQAPNLNQIKLTAPIWRVAKQVAIFFVFFL